MTGDILATRPTVMTSKHIWCYLFIDMVPIHLTKIEHIFLTLPHRILLRILLLQHVKGDLWVPGIRRKVKHYILGWFVEKNWRPSLESREIPWEIGNAVGGRDKRTVRQRFFWSSWYGMARETLLWLDVISSLTSPDPPASTLCIQTQWNPSPDLFMCCSLCLQHLCHGFPSN